MAAPLVSNTIASSLKLALSRANLQSLTKMFEAFDLGRFFRMMPARLYGQAPNTTSVGAAFNSNGSPTLYLPDDAKCETILWAYARTGTGTVGPLTIDALPTAAAPTNGNSAPSAGHVSVAPNGDIQFASADAWTAVDLLYVPRRGEVFVFTLSVSSNVATLPTAQGATLALLEVQSTTGTLTGNLKVQTPGTSVTSGQAALNAAKTQVAFASADAVTQCQVKVALVPPVDQNLLLEQTSTAI